MPDENSPPTAAAGLRRGWTTGSCAAASQAAAVLLLTGIAPPEIHRHTGRHHLLPAGRGRAHMSETRLSAPSWGFRATADITNGVRLPCAESKGRYHRGGAGVGRIPVRDWRCRSEKRRSIPVRGSRLRTRCTGLQNRTDGGTVTISVEDGEALAAQTYNGHLGIVGGISILGTSGIVEPMSEKALVDTIRLELDSLYAQGQRIAFLCPGNYSADFARDTLGLDLEHAVKCSNHR